MILRPSVVAAVTFATAVAQQRTVVVDQTTGPYYEIRAAAYVIDASPRVAMTSCSLNKMTLVDSSVVFDSCTIQGTRPILQADPRNRTGRRSRS